MVFQSFGIQENQSNSNSDLTEYIASSTESFSVRPLEVEEGALFLRYISLPTVPKGSQNDSMENGGIIFGSEFPLENHADINEPDINWDVLVSAYEKMGRINCKGPENHLMESDGRVTGFELPSENHADINEPDINWDSLTLAHEKVGRKSGVFHKFNWDKMSKIQDIIGQGILGAMDESENSLLSNSYQANEGSDGEDGDDDWQPSDSELYILRSDKERIEIERGKETYGLGNSESNPNSNVMLFEYRSEKARRCLSTYTLWRPAWDNLSTLYGSSHVDYSIINFYALHTWFHSPESKVRYIDATTVGSWQIQGRDLYAKESRVIERFRRLYSLPERGACAKYPVIFIVLQSSHFFTVSMDVENATIYVLGRTSQPTAIDNWDDWNGPMYYSHICRLHGWDIGDITKVVARSVSWAQNGYDCGPQAIMAVMHFMKEGLLTETGTLQRPSLICGHIMRLKILEELLQHLFNAYRDYEFSKFHPPEEWDSWNVGEELRNQPAPLEPSLVEEMRNRLLGDQNPGIRSLLILIRRCAHCKHLIESIQKGFPNFQVSNTATVIDMADGADMDAVGPMQLSLNKGPSIEEDEANARPNERGAGRLLRKTIKDGTMASSNRFPRPRGPIELPEPQEPLWPAFQANFDNYFGGPTADDFPVNPRTILQEINMCYGFYPLMEEYKQSSGALFVDYGYRILPRFSHRFYSNPPMSPEYHILSIGVPTGYDPRSNNIHPSLDNYSLSRSKGKLSYASVNDVKVYGLEEILQMGGDVGSKKGQDAYVRGIDHNGKYIALDPERDENSLSWDDIEVAVDIDSIIWITHKVKTALSTKILCMPEVGRGPPISKHNHVYVEILLPQSDEERCSFSPGRSWSEKSFPLSSIPHATFARILDGNSPINVYIFFPRMIHRNEFTNKSMAQIPRELLTLFWDKVVIPALSKHSNAAAQPYLKFTVDEAKLKSATKAQIKGNAYNPKANAINEDTFSQIQDAMRDLIRNELDLERFGSHFYVVEGKGTKLLTMVSLEEASDAGDFCARILNRMEKELPQLDWEYMFDRTNGELYLDIGISFNPKLHQPPMTGLWRMEALEASFGAAGFSAGKDHNVCTMSGYGGKQAEMTVERSRRTHSAHRSAYNLTWEATRPKNNQPLSVDDIDGYYYTNKFTEICSSRLQLLRGAKSKHLGVRDEYRVGGSSLKTILQSIPRRAKKFLSSHPILWIKSETWFQFLARRLEELQMTQMTLNRMQPKNLGILTGIVCNLIRSVDSNPLIVPTHVRNSLTLLRYQETKWRFGIMFLHNLDTSGTRDNLLEDVCQEDSTDVLMALGVNKGRKNQKKKNMIYDSSSSIDYPLGKYPPWSQVKRSIENSPWEIMGYWKYNVLWDSSILSSVLFVHFTQQMWMMMRNEWLSPTGRHAKIATLEEAMAAWSIKHVYSAINRLTFHASKAGIKGQITGRRDASFRQKTRLYFPLPGDDICSGSKWFIFHQHPGYIGEFHQHYNNLLGVEEKEAMYARLEVIFSNIQCLPSSTKPTKNTKGTVWSARNDAVIIVTNSSFYRLVELGSIQSGQRGPKRTAVMETQAGFTKKLLVLTELTDKGAAQRLGATVRRKRRQQNSRRTGHSKNARKPPEKTSMQARLLSTVQSREERASVDLNFAKKGKRRRVEISEIGRNGISSGKRARTEGWKHRNEDEGYGALDVEAISTAPRKMTMKRRPSHKSLQLENGPKNMRNDYRYGGGAWSEHQDRGWNESLDEEDEREKGEGDEHEDEDEDEVVDEDEGEDEGKDSGL